MRKKVAIFLGILVLVTAAYFISQALFNKSSEKEKTDSIINDVKGDGPYKIDGDIEITAKRVCLPHRDQTGPQTQECMYGLKDERTDEYYAIKNAERVEGIPVDQSVQIKGVLRKNDDKKYLQSGTIEINSVSIHYDVPDNWTL